MKHTLNEYYRILKKVPFFLKVAYFAPLNALRMHTAWSKKQPFYSVFLVTPAYNITLEWPPRVTG